MTNRKTTTKKQLDKQGERSGEASMQQLVAGDIAGANANDEGDEVMRAISDMRSVFSSKFDGVLSAIQDIKKDIHDFGARLSEAEQRISTAEDNMEAVQKTVHTHESQIDSLNSRLDDLENRHRRNNLRLVNLPETTEGTDAVKFLEEWLREVFGASLPSPVIIERAHRIGRPPPAEQKYPRVLIMKFLNFCDRQRVMEAARKMKAVPYGQHKVMFFPDFSVEVRRQRRQYDGVKKRLQALNIDYRLRYPAKLTVMMEGQSKTYDSPKDVEKLLSSIESKG